MEKLQSKFRLVLSVSQNNIYRRLQAGTYTRAGHDLDFNDRFQKARHLADIFAISV